MSTVKKMLNQSKSDLDQNHKVVNFWFGFALGVGLTSTAAFFLGTKKGRKLLKQALEMSENFEENLKLLGQEIGENLAEKGADIKEELKELPKRLENSLSHIKKEHRGLEGILNKIKTLSPKPVKRFFAKDGKILNS